MSQRVVLIIAGSDSGGGAGIQADLRACYDHGVFGATAITAVTAQNTRGVIRVDAIPPIGLRAQLDAVLGDMEVHAIKIGMLGTAELVDAVADVLEAQALRPPVVLDPVMVATSGDRLLDEAAVDALRSRLFPLASLATPNLPEAQVLAGSDEGDRVGEWAMTAPCAVLVTGGDASGVEVLDQLFNGEQSRNWRHARIAGGPFHGTGCTLSSAIAARLALGDALEAAADAGIGYVRARLKTAWRPGSGSAVLGPR